MTHLTSDLGKARLYIPSSNALQYEGHDALNSTQPTLHFSHAPQQHQQQRGLPSPLQTKLGHSNANDSVAIHSNTSSQLTLKSPRHLLGSTVAPLANPHSSINDDTLTDKFSRQLTYLRLSITDFCNFRCGYCLPDGYQGKRPDNELTRQEIEVLSQAFAQVGTQKVRITGGEPSIRKDVSDIIRTIKSTQGIEKVAMTSNGYKLGKHIQNWHHAGLNQLNISIDSFDAATFHDMTGFDILPTLLRDIDTLLDSTDIKLKLNGILMESTAYDTLISALAFVKTRPVTYRFIEFMETSDNRDLFFAQHAQSTLIIDYLSKQGWQAQQRGHTDGPAIEYSHPDYVGRIGMIAPYAAHFCDNCNRLRVSSLGNIHLCLFDQDNYDIRPFLQQNDVKGLISYLQDLMDVKPEHHHLANSNSGIMNNLSMIGG